MSLVTQAALGPCTVLASSLIQHPWPEGRAQSPPLVLQKIFLVTLLKSPPKGAEESPLPPQGSDIRELSKKQDPNPPVPL